MPNFHLTPFDNINPGHQEDFVPAAKEDFDWEPRVIDGANGLPPGWDIVVMVLCVAIVYWYLFWR